MRLDPSHPHLERLSELLSSSEMECFHEVFLRNQAKLVENGPGFFCLLVRLAIRLVQLDHLKQSMEPDQWLLVRDSQELWIFSSYTNKFEHMNARFLYKDDLAAFIREARLSPHEGIADIGKLEKYGVRFGGRV